MSNDIAGIVDNDALLVIGSNTSETHPVIAVRMEKAVKNGAALIVADPRKIKLTENAAIHLQHKPGSDAALINALCHVIIREGLADEKFIKDRTEQYQDFSESVKKCTPEWAANITGVAPAIIEKAAITFAKAKNAGIYYTMGITQHTSGTNNVHALANLTLLTGNIGRYSTGLNPLRGQNNVQGSSDMGCLPMLLPGYQRVDNDEARAKYEEIWGTKIPSEPGLTATEMTKAMLDGKISGLWIMGENPVLSDPNAKHAKEALENLEFLVVQDIFLTETAELADVVLPAASFAEKDGTFTNTERRVQRVRRAVSPPGEAKDDLTIINLITSRMQYGFNDPSINEFDNYRKSGSCNLRKKTASLPEKIYNEIGQVWPAVAGINYNRIEDEGIQWPCPTQDHPGTPFLFKDGFPRGKALFTPIAWHNSAELPDKDYPLVLTTGRVLYQYHTGTMTRKSTEIEAADSGPFVQINPADADKLEISDGEIISAESRRGKITLAAKVTDIIEKGVVFMPFHYKEAAANLLTNDALDPICKIPEAKVCAVRISKQQ